jgi:hypothetical protein
MLYASFSGRFDAILDSRKCWFMNHSVRCLVCAGTVVIDPIPAEALSSPSEGQQFNSVEDLVLCSNCGNAIEVKRVDGSSIAAGTLEHGHDLESLSPEDGERANVDMEKGDSGAYEGDLVDQATGWMAGDESEMTLELEEEVSESDLGSGSESDIDLDVSEQEHTFDTSDIDEEEAEPISDAIGIRSTQLHPAISNEAFESHPSAFEANESSLNPYHVPVPFDSPPPTNPELDSLAMDGESSRMDEAELQDAEVQDSTDIQSADSSNSVPFDPADDPTPDGLINDDETAAVEGEADQSWLDSTKETLNDVAVLAPTIGPDWTSIAKRPQTRAQDKSPLWKLLPPVLGGLTALPISIGILWYGFGKDIGNTGPTVARYVPWIVPKHLRGRPQWKSTPDRQLELKKPSLPSGRNSPNLDAGEFGTIGQSGTRPSVENPPKTSLPSTFNASPPAAPPTDEETEPLNAEVSPDEPRREPVGSPRHEEDGSDASDREEDLRNDNVLPATTPNAGGFDLPG